eukprot:1135730-Pyramimonas_sp.AAC.1
MLPLLPRIPGSPSVAIGGFPAGRPCTRDYGRSRRSPTKDWLLPVWRCKPLNTTIMMLREALVSQCFRRRTRSKP